MIYPSSAAAIIDQFLHKMQQLGCVPEEGKRAIIPDDNLHRYRIAGQSLGKLAGAYQLKIDEKGYGVGWFKDWRQNKTVSFVTGRKYRVDRAEIEARKKEYEARKTIKQLEKLEAQTVTANAAKRLWLFSPFAKEDHPYLVRKKIKPYNLRQDGNTLLVPFYCSEGLVNIQRIWGDGTKLFLKNGTKKNAYSCIGNSPQDLIYIVEGWATGASIHAATGKPVAVAGDAGSLADTGAILKEKYPKITLVYAADNDFWTEGNPGIYEAKKAVLRTGGLFKTIPDMPDQAEKPTDFNDYQLLFGLEKLRALLTEQ